MSARSREHTNFKCSLCSFTSVHFLQFQKHFIFHKNDPNFYVSCGFKGCSFSTRNWVTYRVHVCRKHKNDENEEPLRNDDLDNTIESNESEIPEPHLKNIENQNAMFTLALETRDKLSKVSVDRVIGTASELLRNHIDIFKGKIEAALLHRGIDSSFLHDIDFNPSFENLITNKRRLSYYKNELVTYIPPEEIVLGKRIKLVNGHYTNVVDVGYFVPFLSNIQNFLNMPEILHFLGKSCKSFGNESILHDISEGNFFRNNEFYQQHPDALQIAISTDDIEVVNPIGTKIKKHKISVFYFSLLNIPPMFRSRINSIQLLAVAKTKDVKHHKAHDILLKDFISSINKLTTESVLMVINGVSKLIYGALLMVAADTLAAHELGKFKEGVSFALRKCRRCEIDSQSLSSVQREQNCTLRNITSHIERCDLLDSLEGPTKLYWSKLWGINGTSCLLNIHNFDLISCLVQDPMHVLLEGVCPYYFAIVINHLIYVKSYIDLSFLNHVVSSSHYSYLHSSSKPSPVEKKHITDNKKLKETSSSMMTLCDVLPLFVGHRIPDSDDVWYNLLRLCQIVYICLAPQCTLESADILEILIAEFIGEFTRLHPHESFIPKLHYMIHLPSQMRQFGPLRHQWCMRYEAKHTVFTQRLHKNFKNLPYTLANQHQLLMCYVQSGGEKTRSENYLYGGDIVSEGQIVNVSEKYSSIFEVPFVEAYSTRMVSKYGLKYIVDRCAVVVAYEANNIPLFGVVIDILCVNSDIYLVLDIAESHFNKHLLSYTIVKTGTQKFLKIDELLHKCPNAVYKVNCELFVVNSKGHLCELF